MKGQKSNSNHTCLRRPCGGIVLPSIVCLQPFFIVAVNMTSSGYTSSFDLERGYKKVLLLYLCVCVCVCVCV